MSTEGWQKHFEEVRRRQANEVKMDFCGLEIDVDKDSLAEFENWKERVSLPLEKQGTIGGEFTYCLTPTSIGIAYVVKHTKGEEFDLTNYFLW